jgi:integrase/recombinase XerD
MLETHLKSPITRRRLCTGPAAGHIDAFADWLNRQGYKPSSIDNLLTSLAGWTDWMLAAGVHCPGSGGSARCLQVDG